MSFELASSLRRRSPEASGDRKTSKWVALGGAGVVAASLALDQGIPYFNHRRADTQASLLENKNDTDDQVVYTIPGCRNDGLVIANMLEPRFKNLGDTGYVVYPQKGFSIESVKDKLLESRQKNIDKPASFYTISMGGLVLSRLLMDGEFRDNFGEVDKIILDSSPSSIDDVRRPTRRALNTAGMVGESWLVHNAYQAYIRRQARGVDYNGADVTPEQAYEMAAASAKTSLSATVAQGAFIHQSDIKEMELSNVANEVYYVRSVYDDVIDTDAAYEVYDQSYTGIGEVVDTSRSHGNHAGGVVYQKVISEILSGRYEGS